MRGKRVLVTGGAGFIGSHIVAALRGQGSDVSVLDNLSGGNATNVPAGVPLFIGDITDAATIAAAFAAESYDAIIHCAAQTSVPRSVASPDYDRQVNLIGTENLLRFARETRVKKFVFFSSGGAVYGDTAIRADETTTPAPLSPYGVHKLAAEFYVALSGIPYAILRPSNVYGARQRVGTDGGVVAIFLDRVRRGEPLMVNGDGTQIRDFVYVADVVAAACAALTTRANGLWNIASGAETTINALVQHVGDAVGVVPQCVYGPTRAGDVFVSRLSNAKIVGEGWWRPQYALPDGLRDMLAQVE